MPRHRKISRTLTEWFSRNQISQLMKSLINLTCMFVMKQSARQLLNSDILTRKNLFMPQNRSVPDVREKRRNWKKHMSEKDIKHLVFLDESRVNINMTRHYARAWKNQRAVDKTPLNTPCNTTVLSSIRLNGACAYTVYQGGTTAERFAEYLKTKLLPTLSKEDIIVMDNMRSHHAKVVKQLLDSSKVTYLYLPPYSPDLNPIEKMWSKLKAFLRKEKIRIASELPSAISKGFLTIRPKDCIGWFHSCDYVQ